MCGPRHTRFPQRIAAVLFGAILAGGGCGDDDGPTTPPPADDSFVRVIDDLNYVRGRYFLLQHPADQLATNSRIDISTLRLFVDDRNGSNNQGNREGIAVVDPLTALDDSVGGSFASLRELDDYQITTEYYGDRFPVLVLAELVSKSWVLAVTYDEILPGGARRTIGSVPDVPKDPGGERVVLKLLQTPDELLLDSATDPGYYESDPKIDPRAPTRELALKGFYDLLERNIDPGSTEITICRSGTAPADTISAYTEGAARFPYLRILGLDLFTDNGSGAPLEGPDGFVDAFTNAWFLDAERGVLYFPDLRPFDPRISPRTDARPEEDAFFRTRVTPNTDVPGLRGRVLWPPGATGVPGVSGGGVTPAGLAANRAAYDRRLFQASDRKYVIRVVFPHRDVARANP